VTGIGTPRGTPAEVIGILNTAVNAAFADAEMRARLTDTGGEPLPGPPDAFGKIFAGEIEKWGRVVRASGMKTQ
jgi:tripartite-type tricarboxylate transporter receptor subunit TctC